MTALTRAPAPVHVAFTGDMAALLRAIAAQRGESPQVLARAMLRHLAETDFAAALPDDRAEAAAGGQGRRDFGEATLTLNQCAVVFLVGELRGADGWCRHSEASLARRLEMPATTVGEGLAALRRHGVVLRGAPWKSGAPASWRLTLAGEAVFEELAGEQA